MCPQECNTSDSDPHSGCLCSATYNGGTCVIKNVILVIVTHIQGVYVVLLIMEEIVTSKNVMLKIYIIQDVYVVLLIMEEHVSSTRNAENIHHPGCLCSATYNGGTCDLKNVILVIVTHIQGVYVVLLIMEEFVFLKNVMLKIYLIQDVYVVLVIMKEHVFL